MRVELSGWEQEPGSCMRQRKASGPNGDFELTLFTVEVEGEIKVSHSWISRAEEDDAAGYCIATGELIEKTMQAAEDNYTPLLLALASQPTEAEERVLEAAHALRFDEECIGEGGGADIALCAWKDELRELWFEEEARAVKGFEDALYELHRDALKAERERGE